MKNEKILIHGLYLLGSGIVFSCTTWYVNNPDTFQYLSIAKKYATGHWSLAINAYWSPMLSWLLAVPVWMGINGILALKILQFFIGGFAVSAWMKLSEKTGLKGGVLSLLKIGVVPFVISYAQLSPTADLLFLTILLFLLLVLSTGSWRSSSDEPVIAGLIGALLFFSKAFGFPLFLALLISVTLLRYSMEHDRLIWRQALISLMVFLLASSVWILPLSLKYGQMTISKAASFNLTREVAPLPGQVMHLPVLTEGLLAPPDSMSASAWEAPGDVLLLTPLRPFSNKDDRSVYFQLIKRNLLTIYYFDFRRQAGIFFLLFFTGFLFVRGFRALFENKLILLLLLTLLMIYGGYSLILVHTRYVWVCTWIMLLLSAWMAQNIFQSGTHRRILQVVFACLLIIAIKRPVKEVLFTKDIDTTFFELSKACIHPIETMSIVYREEKLLYSFGQKLKNEYHLNGNIASLQNDSPVRHYYSSSLFIASFLPVHYYGQLGLSNSFEVQCRELNEHRIHYLFVWGGESWKQGEAAGYRPIIRESALGLSVYKLDLKE